MLINVVLLIFNLRFLCMTSDYSSVVFNSVCRICVLVSFTLAHQDMLNTASEATGNNWRGEGNNDVNNSTRNVIDIVSQVLSNGTNQTFNRWKPQNIFPEALSHSSFTDSSSPPDHDPFQLGYEAVYIGPEVLVDMEIPDEIVLAGSQPIHRKRPVKDGFSKDQEKILLDLHNLYRGNVTPSASNMNFMEWDEKLAVVAQQWANGCHFEHGFPPGYESIFPKSMGQNLYMGWDHLGKRALHMWYEEYMYYDLERLYCVTNKQCGHYTQMTWGDSKLVGCGMKKCGVRQFYIVCHYHPAGNIVGSRPYIVGKPCSQCNTKDGGLCTNNLCVTKEQCTSNAANCNAACNLECQNCGVLNSQTCTCECSDGWDSLDCSRRCIDFHERCGKSPGWPTSATCSMNHHDVENIYCRKMCGKCRDIQAFSNSRNVCCRGKLCEDGEVLNLERNLCQCQSLCPGPKCYYAPESGSSSKTTAILLIVAMQFVTFLIHL